MRDRVFGPPVRARDVPWAYADIDVPGRAGVYRLEHHPSGYVYVGSSTRLFGRCNDWRMRLRRLADFGYVETRPRAFLMSPKFHAVARGLPVGGWSFVVVAVVDLQHDTLGALHRAELAEIMRLDALAPELLLNVIKTTRPPSYLQSRFKGAGSRPVYGPSS